jgi:predicted  nucleic acid-binding Zn-ribbon protein
MIQWRCPLLRSSAHSVLPMHPDVTALLAVQHDDLAIYALEARLAALAPRVAALEKERRQVSSALDRAHKAVEAEEARHREARGRVETHRQLLERSQRQYESVTSPREATAAMTQLEQTKRMVEESERDASHVQGRVNELRHQVADLEKQLAEVESRQTEARTSIDADRGAIESELAVAHQKREGLARAVPRSMLSKYDRVRARRRSETVFPLRGPSCSACDTAIPTQRRAAMAATGALEMCEGCGVLLYAVE